MATSRRNFIQIVGLNGLAVAAAGCATATTTQGPEVAPQAPPLGAPGTRSSLLRLSSNENSAGPGPKVLAAVQDGFGTVNRYAFRVGGELASALASSHGIQSSQIAVGCGSSEILDAAASAFLGSDRALVTATPTFELLSGRASQIGAPIVEVPVDAELRLDLGQMAARAKGAGLVYICNPNNPTATVHGAGDINACVEAVLKTEPRATILIDEAYHEYVDRPDYKTAIPLALANPRVVVARTFSKIYGMAGLRIGYAVGQSATLGSLNRHLDSFRLSCLSGRAALTALADPARVEEQNSGEPRGARDDDAGIPRRRVPRSRHRRELRDGGRAARHPRLPAGLPQPRRRDRAAVPAADNLGARHHRDDGGDAAGGRGVPRRAGRARADGAGAAGRRPLRAPPRWHLGLLTRRRGSAAPASTRW